MFISCYILVSSEHVAEDLRSNFQTTKHTIRPPWVTHDKRSVISSKGLPTSHWREPERIFASCLHKSQQQNQSAKVNIAKIFNRKGQHQIGWSMGNRMDIQRYIIYRDIRWYTRWSNQLSNPEIFHPQGPDLFRRRCLIQDFPWQQNDIEQMNLQNITEFHSIINYMIWMHWVACLPLRYPALSVPIP